jgi:DNA uptake protein ComE-like DNA-binding protein
MLPGIGEQTARDIVAYREQFRADGRGDTPYAHDLDLLKVKGVGRGTVREAATYLRFPTTRP